MKKILFIAIIVSSLFFVKDVNAQVGCCIGSVTSGTAECPGPGKTNWYCSGTTTQFSCSGLDYGTCLDTRPTATSDIFCGGDVPRCTGCGWSADCSGGGGGGGYTFETCPSGQELVCGQPASYSCLPGGCCMWAQGCNENFFPSSFTQTGCDGITEKGTCQTNCTCQPIVTCGGVTAPVPATPSVTNLTANSATISWTNGTGGVRRLIRVDEDAWQVDNGCPNGVYDPITNPTGCTVYADINPYSSNTYNLTGLTPNTTYYWRIVEWKSGTEWKDFGGVCTTAIHASFTTPVADPIGIHDSSDCTSSTGWACDQDDYSEALTIHFYSDGPYNGGGTLFATTIANLSDSVAQSSCNGYANHGFNLPTPENMKDGTNHSIYAYAINNSPSGENPLLLNSPIQINCPPPVTNPWWQVGNGDVTAKASIDSEVPAGALFNIVEIGGFPGVPVFASNFSYLPGSISDTNWNAQTTTTEGRMFNYAYFENLIPSDFSSPTTYDGYTWTKITGPYTHTGSAYGNARNVIFVDGNLDITGNITLNDNIGFLVVIVSGNITISPDVTNIEGIYVTDGTFSTGTNGPGLDSQLQIRGSVASYTGFDTSSLERDLTTNSLPAEIFTFAPDQVALFPEKLGYRRTRWTEVAP